MTMLFKAKEPALPATSEVNFTINPSPAQPAVAKPVTRKWLARSLHPQPRVLAKFNYQALLAECRKCNTVATYGDLCLAHWQEHTRYAAFSPAIQAAVASFHLGAAYV